MDLLTLSNLVTGLLGFVVLGIMALWFHPAMQPSLEPKKGPTLRPGDSLTITTDQGRQIFVAGSEGLIASIPTSETISEYEQGKAAIVEWGQRLAVWERLNPVEGPMQYPEPTPMDAEGWGKTLDDTAATLRDSLYWVSRCPTEERLARAQDAFAQLQQFQEYLHQQLPRVPVERTP